MGTYGIETFDTIGTGIQVSADGAPIAKAAGVVLYWPAVPVTVGPTTFESEDVVANERYIRYGTILCRVVGGVQDGKYVPYGTTTGAGNTITDATSLSTARGQCFIVNESRHEDERLSDHPPCIDGGRVFQQRLLVDYTGVVAPTGFTLMPKATFEAAFPNIRFVVES